MGDVWYTTRESVKSALDVKETARNNGQVDSAIAAASRSIEGLTHRKFYPQVDTRYFDWPSDKYRTSWRLWLDQDELISVTSVVSGGVTLGVSDYNLRPYNSGPPYTSIETDISSSAAFSSGDTHQKSIAITGVFGYQNEETPAGLLAEALDSSETAVDVTNSSAVGVGSIIRVDNERMIVTEKTMLTTGQTLQTPLAASAAGTTVAVVDGSVFFVGEIILLDSERMLIVDIAANNLTVKRAWDGSTLATHTGSTVYALRTLTVERGALGTTAAVHSLSAAISRHVVPELVASLCTAEAISTLMQQSAGYGRTVGTGDNESELSGKAVGVLRDQVYTRYGRKARMRGV